jgi:hypothetical protein
MPISPITENQMKVVDKECRNKPYNNLEKLHSYLVLVGKS